MTTAALVDDHPVFRQGLKLLFELKGDPVVVGESSGAHDALEMVSATRPDVVLLDIVLGKEASGIAIAQQLLHRNPGERILFLSMVKDSIKVAQALQSGGLGYATKDQSIDDLLQAVRNVAAGQRYIGPALASARVDFHRSLIGPRPPDVVGLLTARERQVFDLTVEGLTAAGIGEKLLISRRTVETHRARILGKLGARSASDLVRIAARAGILEG
jgi:DNA-binding NarL/FixJ family response regulator